MNIGEKVKALRDRKGYSNSDLARLLDMTESNLFSIYKRQHTATDVVEKIMKVTGVPSNYFFDDKALINISQQGAVNTLGESNITYTTSKTDAENVEVAVLKVQLESKDVIIASKDKEIDYLKQIIDMLKSK